MNICKRFGLVSVMMVVAGTAAPVVSADVVATHNFTNKASYKLAGNGGNATATINFGAGSGNVYKLLLSGTLQRNTAGTFPRESCIKIRRFVHISQNISLLTHEFIAQPFTGTQFDANGTIQITDALVLPVPLNGAFGAGFSSCFLSEPGHFELEFFEQFDDNSADNGPTPDATWTNLTVRMDTDIPSMNTAAPLTGNVATTTRYGVRSDDTLDPGAFTGGQIANLAKPVGNRIKHVRVSGYLSALARTVGSELAGPNETSQARIRLRRTESVLLSPNDPQAFSTNDDITVTLPFLSASSQWVSVDIPIPAGEDFGKLTRNVPSGPDESYFGISYLATTYESADHSAWSIDNIWNGLKIEFFSDAQPPAPSIDFGTLAANPAGSETVLTQTGTIPAGQPLWFTFNCPQQIAGGSSGQFLDIDTEGTAPLFDTMIGLYGGQVGNAGVLVKFDDDDGSGNLSQISFGDTSPRPAIGNSMPRNGRDGSISAGQWYVAVVPFVAGTGTGAFGAADFAVTNPDTVARQVRLNLRFNVPLACGPADIGRQGGVAGADGALDNNDFIVFIDRFFAQDPIADRGVQGGVAGSDGLFNNNDFIVFINQFFAGCGTP